MQYAAALPFRGDAGKAFGLAETALTALGFQITQRAAGSTTLVGMSMNSTRQNALLGASQIQLLYRSGELAVEAELGGVARMSKFVNLFPILLVLGIGIVFLVAFSAIFGPGMWLIGLGAAVGANVLLWLVLGPLLARKFRSRTELALNTLLANMVSVGEAA